MNAETPEIQERVMSAGCGTAVQYREVLQTVLHLIHEPGPNARNALATGSHNTAESITELVSAAEALKGG